MVDIDDTDSKVCPIVKLAAVVNTPPITIYKVTWMVHSYDVNKQAYNSYRNERFFSTQEAAKAFSAARKVALDLLGINEHMSEGHPVPVTVEG